MKALWYVKYYQDGLRNSCSPNREETTGMGITAVILGFIIAVVSSVTCVEFWEVLLIYLFIF